MLFSTSASQRFVLRSTYKIHGTILVTLARCLATTSPGLDKGKGLPKRQPIPNVEKILLVSSGKGGVGKSTVSVNLAAALAVAGHRVGLLDADIHGPSLATLLGLRGRRMEAAAPPPEAGGGRPRLLPVLAHGLLHCASMSLLIPDGRAPVWRGLMVVSAVSQLLSGVAWPPLDLLVVDLPPGSGDVPLSVVQSVPVSGCLLVSTAQRVAVADVARHADMLAALRVPVLGLVHNMAAFVCPSCSARHPLFSSDALAEFCRAAGLPVLAELALEPGDSRALDEGRPSVLACPGSANSPVYARLAETVAGRLGLQPPPLDGRRTDARR